MGRVCVCQWMRHSAPWGIHACHRHTPGRRCDVVRSTLEMALTMQLGAWKATGTVQRQGARTTTVVSCVHVRAAPHAALLIPPPLDCQQHPIPPRHPARNLPCCVLDTDGRMRRMMMSAWVAWVHGCRGDRVGATRTRGQQCSIPVVGCVVLYPPPLCPWRCVRRHRLWRYSTRVIPSPTRRCSGSTTPHLHWAPPLFTFPPKSYSVRQARG